MARALFSFILDAQFFQRHGQARELAERIPAQVVFLRQLLHVLRCRAAGAGFVHAAAVHQRTMDSILAEVPSSMIGNRSVR